MPTRAKLLTLVEAGSDTKLNPWPFESAVTIVLGVVAVAAILAVPSTKLPRIWFMGSFAVSVERIPLHSISSELMIPATWLTGRFTPCTLLATVKASYTQRFLTCSDALPVSKLAWALPLGMFKPQNTSVADSPPSHECGPNEPVRLSSQTKANDAFRSIPSVPTKTPSMKRMSAWNV